MSTTRVQSNSEDMRGNRFSLSSEQIATFHRDGFVGPLPRYAPLDLLDRVAEKLIVIERDKGTNPLYGRHSTRDWHLLDQDVMGLFNHEGMIVPLKQLMAEDLILWRSKAFIKPPLGGEIGWHQEWGPFNGAEIGNDVPALQPTVPLDSPWNMTIWFALADIDEHMGPIRFIRGSHKQHFPVSQVPLPQSAFYEDPFEGITDPLDIVRRAQESTLVLDIDTSKFFAGLDISKLSLDDAKRIVVENLSKKTGEVMHPVGVDLNDNVPLLMKKGEFVIFYERTLHGSGRNETERYRPAVNCRVTYGSTLVYPGRLKGEFIDGSNLDISNHRCVKLSGSVHNPLNIYTSAEQSYWEGRLPPAG